MGKIAHPGLLASTLACSGFLAPLLPQAQECQTSELGYNLVGQSRGLGTGSLLTEAQACLQEGGGNNTIPSVPKSSNTQVHLRAGTPNPGWALGLQSQLQSTECLSLTRKALPWVDLREGPAGPTRLLAGLGRELYQQPLPLPTSW